MPTQLPAVHADGAGVDDGQLTAGLRRPDRVTTTPQRLRQLRRQHRPAGQPAARPAARRSRSSTTTQYPNIGDRMTRSRHLVELVLRRLGRRRGRATPGRCSSTTTSRSTTSPTTRPASPAGRTCRTRRSSSRRRKNGTPADGQLRQAVRRGERAPGLRQRAGRQRPPGRPAQDDQSGPQAKDTLVVVTYDEFGGQWDHVPRRPQPVEGARPVGSRHPHPRPGAVRAAASLGRRPHVVRHDVDHPRPSSVPGPRAGRHP